MEVRTFDAPSGERLDVAIAQALAVSRTFAKELVNEGYVTLDGKPVGKPATKLTGREVVSVLLPPVEPIDVEPEDLDVPRSEEHTSELQSRENLVCRLLL